MEIKKEAQALPSGQPTEGQLSAINALAKARLTADQVYVFSLRLCDDQPDRDFERFDPAAMGELARLFVGKSGIVDHQWSAKQQLARIFETQVVCEDGVTYLKAWAYIRRGGAGEEWIADIEAGIKKEVSVGCAMGRSVCSVCGAEYGACGHQKGESYDGQLCVAILQEPVDAYEFSFVAVPAQKDAGVLKGMGGGSVSLKELADAHGAQAEYRQLAKLAKLGQCYEAQLADEVVGLCMALELGLDEADARLITSKLGAGNLQTLKTALSRKLEQRYPVKLQLPGLDAQEGLEGEYLI